MTTFMRKDVTCVNCHKSSTHQVLGSTNTMGSPDLDLRPPEMQRSTMSAWMQLCPHCGYVAPDLSRSVGDRAVVSQSEYRAILQDRRFPELARRFLAHALLSVSSEPAVAAQARLYAAWVCDDARQTEPATHCRRLAAECFTALKPFQPNEQGITQGAVFVDVLRRAGEFERAAGECDALLGCRRATGILRQVLDYQRRLILDHDLAAHRVEECTQPVPRRKREMTEHEWLTCRDPDPMLEFLQAGASRRKLRLFAVACLRSVWPSLTHEAERRAVEVAERHADGQASDEELIQAYAVEYRLEHPEDEDVEAEAETYLSDVYADAYTTAAFARSLVGGGHGRQAELLRDVFGNPFHPLSIDSACLEWNDGTVVKLAQSIYEERTFDRLAILADALEEAGCANRELLDHCRQSEEHVRGCWAIDLLLGKT